MALRCPPFVEDGGAAGSIFAGKRAVTADTALRLGRYFGTSPELWVYLQKMYELDLARATLGAALERLPQRPLIGA